MFNSVFSLGNLLGLYSGSPMMAAVGSMTYKCIGYGSGAYKCADFHGSYNGDLGSLFLVLMPFIFVFMLVGLALAALMVVSWWKIFQKAGRPGWAAIVPIYNLVVMFQIVGMSPWLILLALIPVAGSLALFIVMIFVNIKIAKAFGQSEGFAVGLILLPIVFVPILAFGKSKFTGIAPITSVPPTPPVGPTGTV